MVTTIIKRDGRTESFVKSKVVNAVLAAMKETDQGVDASLALRIADSIENGADHMHVEDIQDAIENKLMASKRKDAAKKFIIYRDVRNKMRGRKQASIFEEIIETKSNDVTRDNANMNADTPAGMMMKFAAESSKTFVDDYLLSEEAREAVKVNMLHVHK